jgi:hypothetical protein
VTGHAGGPILLVPQAGAVPAGTRAYLTAAASSASSAWVFGGNVSVDANVFSQLAFTLKSG